MVEAKENTDFEVYPINDDFKVSTDVPFLEVQKNPLIF